MDKQQESLRLSLEQYQAQLSQIREALKSSSSDVNKQDLYALEKDILELISLTKDTLASPSAPQQASTPQPKSDDAFSDEYALFKAELAELEGVSNVESAEEMNDELQATMDDALEGDLQALKGSKCQAPYKQQWGVDSYYNALIVDIETKDNVTDMEHIQVRVLFVNPMEKDMLPCPYYLDGQCRFTDDKCHFSHGHLVPLSDIREYREPDFSCVREGSQVLAKQKDNLWHRAKVKDILNNNRCSVKFESKGCETVELDLHDLLPLNSEASIAEDEDDSSGSDGDEVIPQEYFVQLSLLRTPTKVPLGAWEKHTKGIGSRLMANMGYVVGCGLGKYGEGRLEPVEAMAYPPGKSLDACMALRESAGGDQNMFKAERRQRKEQQRLLKLQKRQEMKDSRKVDVFSFINSKLSGTAEVKATPSNQKNLSSSSRKGLNVERFRLGEDIKRVQKDVDRIKKSLDRHEQGSATHNTIHSKLREAQSELTRLQNSDRAVAKEQGRRQDNKKMAVF